MDVSRRDVLRISAGASGTALGRLVDAWLAADAPSQDRQESLDRPQA
jgi:hypothetical protein